MFWLLTIAPLLVTAGTVTKISEKRVIVEFNNGSLPPLKAKVVILDQETHKEIGYIEIVRVKDTRALGVLKEGSAKPGDTADIAASSAMDDRREPAKANSNAAPPNNRKEKKRGSRLVYGAGAGFVNTQMMIKTANNSGSLAGNGFALKGAVEYSLTPTWIIFGSIGLHPLVMDSGDSNVNSINTNYLGTEGIARYAFGKRNEGLWVGGGAGYYLTMSSNLTPKPTNEFGIIGSAGYNIKLSSSYFSLKGDFILLQSKKIDGYTYQPYQFAIGGVYFF